MLNFYCIGGRSNLTLREDGKRNGQGDLLSEDGKVLKSGVWKDGEFVGE